MSRAGRLVGASLFAAVLFWPAPAGAVDLDGGCQGNAESLDAGGGQLDVAVAPGPGGTSGDPFLVDYDGTVTYTGSSPAVFHDHSWDVKVMGITVKSGGSENADDESTTADEAEVDDYLPFDAPGLYKVSGSISADEGECSGSAWVQLAGSPVGSIPWIAGVVMTAGGAALLAWAWPTR